MELQVKGALMIQEMFKVSVVGDVQDGKDFASDHFEDKRVNLLNHVVDFLSPIPVHLLGAASRSLN
jgi:hypothetical protein